jgi:subtilisin family serine protease
MSLRYIYTKSWGVLVILSIVVILSPVGVFASKSNIPTDTQILQDASSMPKYVPGEVIVKLRDEQTLQELRTVDYSYRFNKHFSLLNSLGSKYNLKFKRIVFEGVHKRLESEGKSVGKLPDLFGIYLLKTDKNVPSVCLQLEKDPSVEYAQPNYIYKLDLTPLPTVPYIPDDYHIADGGFWRQGSWSQSFPDLWGLQKIQAIEAWNEFDTNNNGTFDANETRPGEGIVVAVIDTGIDQNHPDIKANIWTNPGEIPNDGIDNDLNGYIDDVYGYDFRNRDNNPRDGHGHGTHCSGTIAAVADNSIGIAGVAPWAKIMPLKAIADYDEATSADLAEAIYYAADMGANILSNSWGGIGNSQTITNAVNYAHALGCIIVAAAGNSNADALISCPANIENVIAVSAINWNNNKCSFSNWGTKIDVAAPGEEILSLRAAGTSMGEPINDFYTVASGTSMACPHVAGAAALLLSFDKTLTNEQVRDILKAGATDISASSWDYTVGDGILNIYKSITSDFNGRSWIDEPNNDQLFHTKDNIDISGTATASDFESYRIYCATGDKPISWELLYDSNAPVINGNLYSFDVSNRDDSFYYFRLEIETQANYKVNSARRFYLAASEDIGWPFIANDWIRSGPVIFDVDNDGIKEIIFSTTGGIIYMLNAIDGKVIVKDGWPVVMEDSTYVIRPPSIGDIDGDGQREIVIGGGNSCYKIYAFEANGNAVSGWPVALPFPYSPAAVTSLEDLDGDGAMEIIAVVRGLPSSQGGGYNGRVYVFRGNGSNYPGWPVQPPMSNPMEVSDPVGAPAVGDIDNDGDIEICIATSIYNGSMYITPIDGRVYVWKSNGQLEPGWPQTDIRSDNYPRGFNTNVVLADLDHDSKLEIIVPGCDYNLYIWRYDGTLLNNWPQLAQRPLSEACVADLHNDGSLEIISGDMHYINIWDGLSGSLLQGWPVWKYSNPSYVSNFTSPAVGDIDGDGIADILIGGKAHHKLFGFKRNGTQLAGFPKTLFGETYSAPAIGDIDNDGYVEILIGCDLGLLHCWQGQIESSQLSDWPMMQHNARHTGQYIPPPLTAGDLNRDGNVDYLDLAKFADRWLTESFWGDLYRDGSVNFMDFSILADNWCFE